MTARGRWLLLLIACCQPGAARAQLPLPQVVSEAGLRGLFADGGTLVGVMDHAVWVERYEAGGRVRGTYRGRDYAGTWTIRGTQLCTQHEGADRTCVRLLAGPTATITPGTAFLVNYEGGATGQAYYRRQAPWGYDLTTTLRGVVRDQVEGGFLMAPPDGEGIVYVAWQSEVQRLVRYDEVIVVQGTTDGVSVIATVVLRADGSRVGAAGSSLQPEPAPPKPEAATAGRPVPAPVRDGRGTPAAPASGGLRLGEYACYGSGGRIMAGLGFRVLPGGRYTDLDGGNAGTYAISGGSVQFQGGHLGGQAGRNLRNNAFQIGSMAGCEPF